MKRLFLNLYMADQQHKLLRLLNKGLVSSFFRKMLCHALITFYECIQTKPLREENFYLGNVFLVTSAVDLCLFTGDYHWGCISCDLVRVSFKESWRWQHNWKLIFLVGGEENRECHLLCVVCKTCLVRSCSQQFRFLTHMLHGATSYSKTWIAHS